MIQVFVVHDSLIPAERHYLILMSIYSGEAAGGDKDGTVPVAWKLGELEVKEVQVVSGPSWARVACA